MDSATLKLATVLRNPAEPAVRSRYHDPHEIKALGYNGLVLYETTALSGVRSPDMVADRELRSWVTGQLELVGRQVERARAAGLQVYICYDVLSLARHEVEASAAKLVCKNQPQRLCPASAEVLQRSLAALEGLLGLLPETDGVVIRLGDSDAARLSYLVGNDIYQPSCDRCRPVDAAERVSHVVEAFGRLVVDRYGKRLIVRAWNVRPGGMHDSVALCRRVIERFDIGPFQQGRDDHRLIWSFKFTETDFWRYQRWNRASLLAAELGRWPIMYELECQREFEGKGGIPNWQVQLWRNGAPECDDQGCGGLAQVASRVTLAGLWAWVRGGGWGGPFVDSEAWIDANVFAVPALADNPNTDCHELARRWIRQRLGVERPDLREVIQGILQHSTQVVLHAFYIGPYAAGRTSPWNPNGQWIQDDLVNVEAAWQIVESLDESQLDQLVAEKHTAARQMTLDRVALQQLIDDDNRSTIDPMVNTLLYSESLLAAMRDLFAGLVAYRRYQAHGNADASKLCRQRLLSAQSWWIHHTQRHGALPGTATAFREVQFWERTQQILDQLDQSPVTA